MNVHLIMNFSRYMERQYSFHYENVFAYEHLLVTQSAKEGRERGRMGGKEEGCDCVYVVVYDRCHGDDQSEALRSIPLYRFSLPSSRWESDRYICGATPPSSLFPYFVSATITFPRRCSMENWTRPLYLPGWHDARLGWGW